MVLLRIVKRIVVSHYGSMVINGVCRMQRLLSVKSHGGIGGAMVKGDPVNDLLAGASDVLISDDTDRHHSIGVGSLSWLGVSL